MASQGYLWLLFVFTLPGDVFVVQAPFLSPFFFLCNYHGNVQELGVDQGEVALSVSVSGNPEYYVPGKFYEITVSSSMNFNGFLLTGLYTLSDFAAVNLPGFTNPAVQAGHAVGQNLMCSIVHSHMSRKPQHQLSIMWLSPPSGTGCISFLATATLGDQVLFKDTTVLHMCEEGAPTMTPLRPLLTSINSDGVILRDDFESGKQFNKSIWALHDGTGVSSQCGTVLHGDGAVFCDEPGIRTLTSVPLNLTTTSVLQFAITAGMCRRNPGLDKTHLCPVWLK
ncbi:reelin-like [Liolophura sinensis]|uniref:reelin-like n=1 Tax=Liolophura sinensis TaxID=3198878 RepID=UPI0031586F81